MLSSTLSNKLDASCGEEDHAQQQQAVAPSLDVGDAVGALPVADRPVDDFAVEFGRAEEQVEVAERVEVAEGAGVGILYARGKELLGRGVLGIEPRWEAAQAGPQGESPEKQGAVELRIGQQCQDPC